MTLTDGTQGHSLKSMQLMQIGSLLFLVAMGSLILAFLRQNGFMLGVVITLGTVVVPTVYVLGRRLTEKARQREMEARLMTHTRTYLRNEEPARGLSAAEESDLEILARAIDGRKLPIQDFRKVEAIPSLLPVAVPVVFNALPRRYATASVYERRFADRNAALPIIEGAAGSGSAA